MQSFTFASECGMLHFSQEMLEIFKRMCDTLSSIPDANLDDGFAYWKEVIWNTKQEFRCRYSFPLAANNINIHSPGFVMEFIDAVV